MSLCSSFLSKPNWNLHRFFFSIFFGEKVDFCVFRMGYFLISGSSLSEMLTMIWFVFCGLSLVLRCTLSVSMVFSVNCLATTFFLTSVFLNFF